MKTSRVSLAVIAGAVVFLCAAAPHSYGANPDPKPSTRQQSGTPATAGIGPASRSLRWKSRSPRGSSPFVRPLRWRSQETPTLRHSPGNCDPETPGSCKPG